MTATLDDDVGYRSFNLTPQVPEHNLVILLGAMSSEHTDISFCINNRVNGEYIAIIDPHTMPRLMSAIIDYLGKEDCYAIRIPLYKVPNDGKITPEFYTSEFDVVVFSRDEMKKATTPNSKPQS